jgi:hypothetical protein
VPDNDNQFSEAKLSIRRPVIRLTFNQAMDRESVNAALEVEPPLPLALNWEEAGGARTLVITSTQPLAPGRQYTLTLARHASSGQGLGLTDPYTWTLRTKPLVATSYVPTRFNCGNSISLRFNYVMATESVEKALRIEPPLAGELDWSEDGAVATYRLTGVISASTAYTVGFEGPLYDANGDALLPPAPFRFETAPAVVTKSPIGSSTNPFAPVRITFDRLMDHTATADALYIEPRIPGQVTWDETTMTFEPDEGYFAERTAYTVTVGTGARGAGGESVLSEAYTWRFHTGQLRDVASFGWGPNAQVLDVNGRRAVQYVLQYRQPELTPTFELYALSLEQFLDRYASGFRGVAGSEKRPISTEGTTLVKRWEASLVQPAKGRSHIQEAVIPQDVPAGLYVLNATAGHVNDQLILVLTSNTVVVKQAEGQIVAWVTELNGGPVPGVEVAVYARDGTLISQGPADANGVYRAEVTRDPQPLIVVARQGNDVTACGLSNEWQGAYNRTSIPTGPSIVPDRPSFSRLSYAATTMPCSMHRLPTRRRWCGSGMGGTTWCRP